MILRLLRPKCHVKHYRTKSPPYLTNLLPCCSNFEKALRILDSLNAVHIGLDASTTGTGYAVLDNKGIQTRASTYDSV